MSAAVALLIIPKILPCCNPLDGAKNLESLLRDTLS